MSVYILHSFCSLFGATPYAFINRLVLLKNATADFSFWPLHQMHTNVPRIIKHDFFRQFDQHATLIPESDGGNLSWLLI